MKNNFIKVVSPELANLLATRGFQYMKEGCVFVFSWSDELIAIIRELGTNDYFVFENKLRF